MKLFGKATVKADGQELLVDKGSKLTLGGNKRNTVKGDKVLGYAEEAQEASVEVNHYISKDTDLDALANMDDVTVTFQADSGQTYVLAHAWLENPPEATADANGGKTPLKFVAVKAEKV